MIQKIKLKEEGTPELEETWLAPYAGQECFLIDYEYLILGDEVYDFNYSDDIYDVIQEWE